MQWSLAQWGVVLFLSLLASASWWLNRQGAERGPGAGLDVPAGFEARGIKVAQYLPGGDVKYRLQADSMKQYGTEQPTVLSTPVLEHFEERVPITRFAAPMARWHEEAGLLHFPQQLTVRRAASDRTPPLFFQADDALVYNDRGLVSSKGHVIARLGNSTIEGTGLEYDWNRRVLVLNSRVRVVYAKKP